VTSGSWRASPQQRIAAAWLVVAAFGLLHVAVNAASVAEELARAGRRVALWEPWVWEGSSTLVWLAMLPLVFLAAQRLQPPRTKIAAAAGVHALLTIPVSLVHVGLMNAIRHSFYGAIGQSYSPRQPLFDILLYEYRKDVISYLLLVAFFLLFERVARPAQLPTATGEAAAKRIAVRDGNRTHWVDSGEVEWVQSAGNYVELHGRFGTLLHRTTLGALERELAQWGFVRVHRSRLVRKDAVAAVETKPSGDFELALGSGVSIGGSRRFRDRL
jgi:hypothetical protein